MSTNPVEEKCREVMRVTGCHASKALDCLIVRGLVVDDAIKEAWYAGSMTRYCQVLREAKTAGIALNDAEFRPAKPTPPTLSEEECRAACQAYVTDIARTRLAASHGMLA